VSDEPDEGRVSEPRDPRAGGRFVVPDPGSPPEGEATGFVMPATPPPAWPPGAGPPTAAHVPPVPPVMPTAPPVQQAPPVPQFPTQQFPGQQPPPGGWYAPEPAAAEPAPKSSRAGSWITAVVIALVAAVGAFFAVQALLGGDGEVTGAVDECNISADGSLTASGWVQSEDALDGTVEITFEDADGGGEVDRDTVEVSAAAGERAQWTASGSAGADVQGVTCLVDSVD